MSDDLWPLAKAIVAEALERPEAERAVFVDERCGGRRDLEQEVESLIDAHLRAGRFIDQPFVPAVAHDEFNDSETTVVFRPGTQVGDYRLLKEIKADPANVQFQFDLADMYGNLAASQRETRRLDEALRSIEHSLQISETAAKKNPDFVAHRFNYAGALRLLGSVQRDRGAIDDAILAYRRGIDVFASLPADQRDPKQSLGATADLGLALADQARHTGTSALWREARTTLQQALDGWQAYQKGAGAREDLDKEIAAVTAALAQVRKSSPIRSSPRGIIIVDPGDILIDMKTRDLARMGIPAGACSAAAQRILQTTHTAKGSMKTVLSDLQRVADAPEGFVADPAYGELARLLVEHVAGGTRFVPRDAPAPYQVWGDNLEATALEQMKNACNLPVAAAGALMPDAHVGYGLPIGGVLATHDAVIPYAVGVDIACRMKMTVLDLPTSALDDQQDQLVKALERETRFGVGGSFKTRRQHDVMDADWDVTSLTARLKDRAWSQLGTSGSGNHFVEYGVVTVLNAAVGLPEGTYLAILSHSGSRGTGAQIAAHYSKLAREAHPELPQELSHLSWLDLSSEPGQEYWAAMELMGQYAAANHALIHSHMARALGAEVLLDLENHHNYAWRERHLLPDGTEREVIVHRKGATPAGAGVLGIIPGSMGTPGYVVRGKGSAASLNSASHGAGRRMSRTKAKETFNWDMAQQFLRARGVTLLSAGLDEVPMAYKDIDEVMAAQQDLVEPLAKFEPRLVKMAPSGETPED